MGCPKCDGPDYDGGEMHHSIYGDSRHYRYVGKHRRPSRLSRFIKIINNPLRYIDNPSIGRTVD